MPKHQQRASKTPYSRPTAAPQKEGFLSRLKNFFWSDPKPAELGPPRVISNEDQSLADDTGEASRITHTTIEIDDASTPSNIAGKDASHSASNLLSSNAEGPNEALRQFFEEKGDGDLSNMEVVGVLSLIGQAVSRNESLVDFSNLNSTTAYNSTVGLDPTPSNTSILRDLAPPSPRPYLRGTPPSTQARTRSSLSNNVGRSPWASPRPSRISARHSIGYGRPSARHPLHATAKPTVSNQYGSSPKIQQNTSKAQSKVNDDELTPATSAILRALHEGPSRARTLSTEARKSTSTPFRDNAKPAPATNTIAVGSEKAAEKRLSDNQSVREPLALKKGSVPGEDSTSNDASTAGEQSGKEGAQSSPGSQPIGLFARSIEAPKTDVSPAAPSKASPDNVIGSASAKPLADPGAKPSTEANFEFDIPVAKTSREMTPAEEVIVAKSQAEFTF